MKMTRIDIKGVVAELRRVDSFLISTHTSPDGDAIGSMLALAHFLRALGKDSVVCASHDPVPRLYEWLPGAGEVVNGTAFTESFELAIMVDVAQLERLGSVGKAISSDQKILVLDHHLDEHPSGALNLVDPTYAAASEIVFELFEEAGIPLTQEAAECIYVGLATDTGGFRFSNTNPRAHRIAARLLEAGVDASVVSSRVFEALSRPKFSLLQCVLNAMVLSDEGRLAYSSITERDMAEAKATGEDVDGLVNYGLNIEGVQVGVLFREVDSHSVKVSLRSRRGFNSAKLLKAFGGGGHAAAAGATLTRTLEDAQEAILQSVRRNLESDA